VTRDPDAAPTARVAALALLHALDDGCDTLDQAWERIEPPTDPRDAALARELALGAVRWQRLYDWLLSPHLRTRPPDPMAWALRIGAHQLLALDRIPPSAAVDATLDALAARRGQRWCGAANACLRRLAERVLPERQAEGPLGRLPERQHPADPGIRHSLPDALVRDLQPALLDHPERRLEDLDRRPPLCTRTPPGIAPPTGRSIVRQDGPWTWWSDPDEAIAGWVEPGRLRVQDRAQGRLIESLEQLALLRPGMLAADWCAAPGGKTIALRERHLTVVACDRSRERLGDLAGPRLIHDGRRAGLAAGFDLVLVDAPCSNTGTLARHPEARWRWTRANRDGLAALQRGLLKAASKAVRPDGVLVYATCSLLPCENQAVAHGLDGWRLLAEHTAWPDGWQAGGYHAVLVRA
jgi:16S rRNA (cytosine967-C5)-methyltransferase